MLSQKYRFHSRGGVNFVYQHGQVVRTTNAALTFMSNSRGQRRFAVVVSKKVLKSAVGRNRLRRRFYEALRLEGAATLPPFDGIFTLYTPALATIPFSELRRSVRDLLDRALATLS